MTQVAPPTEAPAKSPCASATARLATVFPSSARNAAPAAMGIHGVPNRSAARSAQSCDAVCGRNSGASVGSPRLSHGRLPTTSASIWPRTKVVCAGSRALIPS